MEWREMYEKARDLSTKASQLSDPDEIDELMEEAQTWKKRGDAAKFRIAVEDIDTVEEEKQPPAGKPELKQLMIEAGYDEDKVKAVIDSLAGKAPRVDGSDDDTKGLGDFLGCVRYRNRKRLNEVYGSQYDPDAFKGATKAFGWMKDLEEGDGSSGGYLVPEQQLNRLLEGPGIAPIIRPNGAVRIPMSSRSLTMPSLDQSGVPTDDKKLQLEGGVQARWVAEGGAKPEQEPSFNKIELVANKLAGHTQASDELLADSAAPLEAVLRRLFGRAITRIEDYYFINGNGVGQPLGILESDALIASARGTANDVTYDDICDMWARLPAWSMGSATWFVSQRALSEFMQMEDGAGNNVFFPQESGGAKQNVMGSVFGRPLVVTEMLPDIGTQGDVLLADLSYYLIGDRQATTIQSSIHYAFVNDLTTWRFVHRVDGQPWIEDPIYISTSDTVSPFVALAA